MYKLISLLGLICSLFVYYYAPTEYSFSYSIGCLFIFLTLSILHLIKNFDGNYFTFDTLFIISIFFTNFVYPVFYYSSELRYFSLFTLNFPESVITKATALCLLGMSAYFFGASLFNSNKFRYESNKVNVFKFDKHNNKVVNFSIVLFILFIITVGGEFLSGSYRGRSNWTTSSSYIYWMLKTILSLAIIMSLYLLKDKDKIFKHINKKIILLVSIICALFLWIGDRGFPLSILLLLLGVYSHIIKPLSFKKSIFFIIAGLFIFSVVGEIRVSETSYQGFVERFLSRNEISNPLEYANSLIINNRSLYVLYDYAENYDYFYGKNFISSIAAVIPFMQSFLIRVIGFDLHEINTAEFVTYLQFGRYAEFGLGTNLIGGIYLSFGVLGVIFIMMLFGKLMTYLYYISRFHLPSLLVYMILFSYSIYYPRADITSPLQETIWILIFYFLFFNRKRIALYTINGNRI